MDFTSFQVRKCPPTAMYIPNFITSEEEQRILSQIERTPKPKWTQLLSRRLINYGGIPHPNGMVAEEIPDWLQAYVNKINNLSIFESQKANHVLVNEYLPGQGIMPHTDGPLFFPTISTISCGSHTVLEFMEREHTPTSPTTTLAFISNSTAPSSLPTMQIDSPMADLASSPAEAPTDTGDDEEKERYKREVRFKLLLEPRSLLILKDSLYSDYLHSIRELKQDILCDRICNYENCESAYKMGDCLQRGTRISLTIRNVPKTSKMKLKFF